jgi:tetratricopeptide (TPR) repeat protein
MAMGMEAPETATPMPNLQAASADHVSASPVVAARVQDHVILVPLESRALRLVVLIVIVLGTAWMAKAILNPALVTYLVSDASSLAELERAVAWSPANPELHLRLAHAYEGTIDAADMSRARHRIELALRLQPTSGPSWLQLAQLADRLGERERARQALDMSLRLDPHNVRLRWEAALLTLRWDEPDTALEHLRYVLAVDPAQADAAFQLARTILTPGLQPASLLPSEPEPLLVIIRLAMLNDDLPLARAAWQRLGERASTIPADLQRAYLEFLLQEGDEAGARQLWTRIVSVGVDDSANNLMWNGGFERERLRGWGFDWQVRHAWGVEVSLDRFAAASGRQSLRLTFNSFPTLDFSGVYQFVVVEPGAAYRLQAFAKALDFTTQSGVKLQVVTRDGEKVLSETPAITGTTAAWVALEAHVQVPSDTTLVMVRIRRERAPGPEGNLGGKVWLDDIMLTPVGRTAG